MGALDTVDERRACLYFASFTCMGLAVGVIGPLLPQLKVQSGNSGSGVCACVLSNVYLCL